MDRWIDKIHIIATEILTKEQVDVFKFEPINGVNVFYCPNGFGKSTLFRLLKKIFQFNNDSEYIDLNNIIIGNYYISDILVSLRVGEQGYNLKYQYKENVQKLERAFPIINSAFNTGLFNQNISDNEIKKNNFMDKRTTIASLNRYSFASNDRIITNNSRNSDIIDAHRDGKAKGILFDYILGSNFKYQNKDTLSSMGLVYKYNKNEYEIKQAQIKMNNTTTQQKEFGIFLPIHEEKVNEIKSLEKSLKDIDISLIDLEYATKKLKDMLNEIKNQNEYQSLSIIVKEELNHLESLKEPYQQNRENKYEDLTLTRQEYSDWMQNNLDEKNKLEYTIRKQVEENKKLKPVDENYKKEIKNYREIFQEIYYNFLKQMNYDSCKVDFDRLKLDVSKVENHSEATLKISRLLFLLSLQIFKKNHSQARTLGIGFYDGLLDGVGYDKIERIINTIKTERVQIFLFIPKLTKDNDKDSFLDYLVSINEIKLYTADQTKKIFSVI